MTKEESCVLELIEELLKSGKLKAGDKIPSERQLCERQLCEQLRVTRGYVRKALQRLEYYGVLRTLPQSGSVVEKIGGKTLVGIIQAIIQVDEDENIISIMDTRAVLECYAARLAAQRADPPYLAAILAAHTAFHKAAEAGQKTLDEDHLFHLSIAQASGNRVALSLISIMTPKQVRRDSIRMISEAGHGHPGGALGAADILALLYAGAMRVKDAGATKRDRLVLSNGHICAA